MLEFSPPPVVTTSNWQRVQDGWWVNHINFGWRPCSLCEAVAAFDAGWEISLGCPVEDKLDGYDPTLNFYDDGCNC